MKKRRTPITAYRSSFSNNDPDQLIAEIGAMMSGLSDTVRSSIQRELDEIEGTYSPDMLAALEAIRNRIAHGEHAHEPDFVSTNTERVFTITTKTPFKNVEKVLAALAAGETKLPMVDEAHGSVSGKEPIPRPPEAAEKLLYFVLPKRHREAILGDLEEDFPKVCQKFGSRSAMRWYWWHVIGSVLGHVTRSVASLLKAGKRIIGS